MAAQRLDKFIASQGFGSRREVAAMIRQGRVCVDGAVCRKADSKVDAVRQRVFVDDRAVNYKKHLYIMMNKPAGVLSASRDPRQKTVIDLLPPALKRRGLFPAGRLDKDTEGFLLITDDGGFAHRMLSPKKEIYKIYEAVLDGEVTKEDLEIFKKGVILEDGTKCLPARLHVVKTGGENIVHIAICEGKFHQVKRMMASIGRIIIHLKRIKIGGLVLDPALKTGDCRELSFLEINRIFDS